MKSRITLALLPIALMLTTATQLRSPVLPIGPGELLLFIWLVPVIHGLWKLHSSPFATESGRVFTCFWILALGLLAIGTMFGLSLESSHAGTMLHDALAYGLALAVCLGFVLYPYSPVHLRRLLLFTVLAYTLPGTALWFYALVVERLGNINLWYGIRFCGWAVNPNQFALLTLTAPFLAFHYVVVGGKTINTYHMLICSVLAGATIVVGWSTYSGALRLAWTICFSGLAVGLVLSARAKRADNSRLLVALLFAVIMATVMTLIERHMPINTTLRSQATKVLQAGTTSEAWNVDGTYYDVGELSVRQALLVNGLKAIASSPLVGYGPGSFSGIEGPFQGSEAHNSLVDWGASTGLAGVVGLLALVVWLAYRLWLAGYYSLLAGLAALLIFGQFHHILRHPLVWAYLVLTARLAFLAVPRSSAFVCLPRIWRILCSQTRSSGL